MNFYGNRYKIMKTNNLINHKSQRIFVKQTLDTYFKGVLTNLKTN